MYKQRRDKLRTARVAKLSFISIGACLQVAATQVPTGWKATASLIGGAFTALAGVIKNNVVTSGNVSQMVTSFYIAQAIKSEVNKFRAKGFPYDKSKNNALELLRHTCNSISKNGNDKMFHTMEKDNKPVPVDMSTKYDYITKRVEPRINKFLIRKGKEMAKRGKFCSNVENILIYAGASIGFLSTSTLPLPAAMNFIACLTGWTAAFTTVSTAFANHQAKMKFEEIAEQYFDTAEELRDIVETWPMNCNKAGDPGWSEQIDKCEELIISTTEDFARKRTGNNDLSFTKPKKPVAERHADKVWNPNVICGDDESGGYPAKDRVIWLMENKKMTEEDAQKHIMAAYAENF